MGQTDQHPSQKGTQGCKNQETEITEGCFGDSEM